MKDSLDRIDFVPRRKGGEDSRIENVYEYSKSGQIVARTANGVRQTYEYDKKGQLLAVKDDAGNAVESYAYDKAGNMLKKQILRSGRAGAPRTPQSEDYSITTFTFDAANQLVSSTTDGVTTHYAYDAAGRLVREGSKTYRYGYLDKVLSVTDGDTTRTYTYHADGQLASASYVDNGRAGAPRTPQSESFLWDGLALIQRGDEQFINEPHVGGGNPVASSKGTSYLNDALGTTVGSKSNGKYSAAALTAFGEDLTVHSPTPTQNSNFFTGKPYVEGLGHAFLMRNYRAGLAKWQTADPMGYPDGWNQLAYCGNRATHSVDVWGGHQVPVIGIGHVFELVDATTGFGFSVRVWGECGGLTNPYISIKSEYFSPDGGVNIMLDDGIGIESYYKILSENHESHQNMFGGVAIEADFLLYMELTIYCVDELEQKHVLSQVNTVRYGEFHCEHGRNIFE